MKEANALYSLMNFVLGNRGNRTYCRWNNLWHDKHFL